MPQPPPTTAAPQTTLLRIKRHRADSALDTLHVALPPSKRTRLSTALPSLSLECTHTPPTRHVRFRRLLPPAPPLTKSRTSTRHAAVVALLAEERHLHIIDVDAALVRRYAPSRTRTGPPSDVRRVALHRASVQEPLERFTAPGTIFCNGVPMRRTKDSDVVEPRTSDEDGEDGDAVYDIFAPDDNDVNDDGGADVSAETNLDERPLASAKTSLRQFARSTDDADDTNVAYIYASELPEFDFGLSDSSDDEAAASSDADAESIDYPSTPESSVNSEVHSSADSFESFEEDELVERREGFGYVDYAEEDDD